MRLFVAADLSSETRRELRRVRNQLQPRLDAARVPPRLMWVADEAAHITLRFLGSVPDEHVPAIEAALQAPIDLASFTLSFQTVGAFPSGRSPRVVWLGPTDGIEPMRRLAALVNARVTPIAGPAEDRPYSPHVTLARVKDPGRGVGWTRALASVTVESTLSRIDHVTLYQSHVTANGSTYTERMRAPLG